ncbi:MAG: hypothetical protein SWX82_31385 [Cyanobacteriota bacterium]|nr:hypothetical protein [Cyanobacteriota bacterium]
MTIYKITGLIAFLIISTPVIVNYSYYYFSPTPLLPLPGGVRGGSPAQENLANIYQIGTTPKGEYPIIKNGFFY